MYTNILRCASVIMQSINAWRRAHESDGEGGGEGEAASLAVQLLQQRNRHHLPQRLLLLVLERVLQPRQRPCVRQALLCESSSPNGSPKQSTLQAATS